MANNFNQHFSEHYCQCHACLTSVDQCAHANQFTAIYYSATHVNSRSTVLTCSILATTNYVCFTNYKPIVSQQISAADEVLQLTPGSDIYVHLVDFSYNYDFMHPCSCLDYSLKHVSLTQDL